MSKVCVFIAPGLEECEALVPTDILRRAGVEVTLAAVSEEKWVTGSHGIRFETDCLARDLDLSGYDMVFLPGGMPGTKNLEASELVRQAVCDFAAQGKKVAAICAAPSVLGHLGLLKGRRAACYPGFEPELEEAQVCTEEAVTDGPFVTGRGLGTAVPFGLALVEALEGRQEACRLAGQIVWMHGEQA